MKAISSRASGKGGSRKSALHSGNELECTLCCAMCMLFTIDCEPTRRFSATIACLPMLSKCS